MIVTSFQHTNGLEEFCLPQNRFAVCLGRQLSVNTSIQSAESMSRTNIPLNKSLFLAACFVVTGCARTEGLSRPLSLDNAEFLPVPDISVRIPSLSSCANQQDTDIQLDSSQPVTIIVHGCFASTGQFRSLADVFAFHGQQTVCFNYDDRKSLEVTSAELIQAIDALSEVLQQPTIDVIGHSQGGLVARRALISDRDDRLVTEDSTVRLTTISAPFGGIQAAAHCGSKPLAWLSLGLTKPICRLITGAKYREIPPNSDFILDPGELLPVVEQHLKIATDETGTCRRINDRGACVEDDFVFSLEEQAQPALAEDAGLSSIVVEAGHAEIVGDVNLAPTRLIEILQAEGILNSTPAESAQAFDMLLRELYASRLHMSHR